MSISRRQFMVAAGGASALSLTSCGGGPLNWLEAPRPPAVRPFSVGAGHGIDEATHVLRRVTYGPRPDDETLIRRIGIDAYLEQQLDPAGIDDSVCEGLVRRFESVHAPLGELFEYKPELLRRDLTGATITRAVYSRRQLHEVMVEFWTDHFNIATSKGDCAWLKAADDREVIRTHALGSFREMVRASALSPAMLWYLDGRANRRRNPDERPNENYARELLELHTLGVHGGYTQRDVMEVARCLTGWTVRSEQLFFKGRVEFHADSHDDGEKSVLGERIPAGLGRGDVDRVVELVTRHPSTARHIAWKLCRRFISDSPPDDAVALVAAAFERNRGDIRETLRAVFGAPAFRSAIDMKFKRPYRFLVSALRATGALTDAGPPLQEYLTRMGHAPFQYPTPDGYPEEAGPWAGTFLWRWHFVAALRENRISGTRIHWDSLNEAAGGDELLAAHFLGRKPTDRERRAWTDTKLGPAVMLASPAFQRY